MSALWLRPVHPAARPVAAFGGRTTTGAGKPAHAIIPGVKVVIAHNRYSSAQPSGENSMVDNEIGQLTAAGVEVVPFQRSSDEIAELSLPKKLALAGSPIYSRGTQKRLARLIEAERPDVFHLHNPYPFLSPAVVRTAQRLGVPVVQTVHNYRQVCMSAMYFRDGHMCHDCRGKSFALPGIKHACYRGSRAQSVIMATTLAVNRGTWHGTDRFIALTEHIAAHLRDYGIEPERIRVKPNSIPDPGPHEQTGTGFLYLGRLTQDKGVDLLLEAWQRHPEHALDTLTIIGDGPRRELVEAAAARRADIDFVGPVPHEQIPGRLRSAAALVVPSLWEDVFPTVILEALSNGRPALTTDIGGPPKMIGEAGVVAQGTVESLAAGLAELHGRAAALSKVAREKYLGSYSPEVVLSRQLDIYAELAGTRG